MLFECRPALLARAAAPEGRAEGPACDPQRWELEHSGQAAATVLVGTNWEAEGKGRSWLKAARGTRAAPEEGQSQDPPQNGISSGGTGLFLQCLARALPEAAAPKWVIVAAAVLLGWVQTSVTVQ